MNFRLTGVLLAGVGVALVGMLTYLFLSSDKETPDLALDGLAGVKAEEIDTVELKRTQPTARTLVFTREKGGEWACRDPQAARLDQTSVNELVRDLLAARPTVHPDLAAGAAKLGLDNPTVEVTLRKGSDRSSTLRVGLTSVGGSRAVTFVSTAAEPDRPFAVPATSLHSLFKDAAKLEGEPSKHLKDMAHFRAKTLFSASGPMLTDARSVKLKRGKTALALERDKSGTWVITVPAGLGEAGVGGDPASAPTEFVGVRPLLLFLAGLAAGGTEDFIENVSPEDEKKYGLSPDDPDVIRIDYTPEKGPTEILYVGRKVESKEKDAPTAYYARRLGDSAVVKVRTDRIDALAKTVADPNAMRNRDLLTDADREGADAVDITTGGAAVSVRKVPKGRATSWVFAGASGPPEVNGRLVDDLLVALARPRSIVDFPAPPANAFEPANVRGTVRVWIRGLSVGKPDTALKGTPVEFVFGRPKGEYAFVRKTAGGHTTVGRVPASFVPLAVKTRLDLIDPRVPSFATTAVTRLAFTVGAEAVEFEQGPSSAEFPLGKWTWTKPEGKKGKVADAAKVRALLDVAATISPGKVVAENPSPDELTRFGFDPKAGPRLSVTVTSRGEKDLRYEFGADAEEKGFVYARHGGSPVVYTVPRVVPDRFRSEDLTPTPPAEAAPLPRPGK